MKTEIDQKTNETARGRSPQGSDCAGLIEADFDTAHSNGTPRGSTSVRDLVRAHLGVADELLDDVPTVTAKFDRWRHISVHSALEAFLSEARDARVFGVALQSYIVPSLAELLITPDLDIGPIDYINLPSGDGDSLPCLQSGLILTSWHDHPLVAWVHIFFEDGTVQPRFIAIEAKTASVEAGQSFLAAIRESLPAHDPYRGKSLKINLDRAGNITSIDFEQRPKVDRDQIILRPGVLEAVEVHAVGIGKAANRLRAAGRHLKRGLLLYGPPGTGKTHTIRYITSRLTEATLFVLTGGAMHQMKAITSLLTDLAPAIVVLDDVDLIAEARDSAGNRGSALFNLLDAMDGMREDIDVLFICTSNRAEVLEKAIASRPGRIDQAIELDVPDADCRLRLINLYGEGLDLHIEDVDAIIDRTAGVTASFIKELLRRASLVALEDDAESRLDKAISVTDRHLHTALDILLDPSKPLTPALLGIHAMSKSDLERKKVRGVGEQWCGI